MDAEFKSLEDKLTQLVKLCRQLREDNHQLRQEVATALTSNRQMEGKIAGATTRLEALLQQIPDEAP